jgi:hypothetical protein
MAKKGGMDGAVMAGSSSVDQGDGEGGILTDLGDDRDGDDDDDDDDDHGREISNPFVTAGGITKNLGGDRGREGGGGAKVWAQVLYEAKAPKCPTERFVLVTAHGMNDGYKGGAGSDVTEDNFFSFARVTVKGFGQAFIATHLDVKRKDSIARAKIVAGKWNVDAPPKGRSVSEFVVESRAKELAPEWFP